MKNPGLTTFAAATTYTHPRFETINRDDPDFDPEEEEGEGSDYMPPSGHGHEDVGFGRWRNPGQSLRVPVHIGPPYQPGEKPGDVIYGEIVSPEEQDAADRIIHGEHESAHPSVNPFVAKAQEDLHTSASSDTVETLSGLLKGGSPDEVGGLDEAHDWLSQRFDGVRVNPHHGTLETTSPAGKQLVMRHRGELAVPEGEPAPADTFSLTNKHGKFESRDPHRLVRTMMAFQIMHNEYLLEQRRRKEEEDNEDGISKAAGWPFKKIRDAFREGLGVDSSTPHPEGAVFEPGLGTDQNGKGHRGGWIAPAETAPTHWRRYNDVAYSPGHHMNELLDPAKASKPEPDPLAPGHTYTYIPSGDHQIKRQQGGTTYFVTKLHPDAVHGRNVPKEEEPEPAPAPPPRPARAPRSAPGSGPGRMPMRGRVPGEHTSPLSLPPSGAYPTVEPQDLSDLEPPKRRPRPNEHEGAVKSNLNDLCPVCASGYLEQYDGTHHECLNCGSLVKQTEQPPVVKRERSAKTAARRPPRGGLGRGLKDIMPYEGDPLALGTGGSENPDNVVDLDETQTHHPLAGEELDPDAEVYTAPKRLLDKQSGEMDPIDEFMGKHGFSAAHKPGHARLYVKPDEDVEGAYYRLTEGAPHPQTGERGWALTLDHIPSRETWMQGEDEYPGRSISLQRSVKDPNKPSEFRQALPDPGNRILPNKVMLAAGSHPVDDDHLNRAIRDVGRKGRNSATFWNAFNSTAYEPPLQPAPGKKGDPFSSSEQRRLRGLSSVDNPGLTRFVG